MKKYVLFYPFIAGMGGGQMYIRNKVVYLRNSGWVVDVICSERKGSLINELKEFKHIFPEIIFPTCYFLQSKKERIVKKISNTIIDADYDSIVIESSFIATSTWGEAVASQIGAKHLIFLLNESNVVTNSVLQRFLIYKHQRKELVSITPVSLKNMFDPFYQILPDQSYWLPAFCDNVEADIESPIVDGINRNNYDYIVGCLGRLEKPFMVPAVTDFCKYAKKNNTNKFLLLFIGGAPNNYTVVSQIKKLIQGLCDNVDTMFTGYLYPVPTKLLEMCDMFFASAGSAYVCQRSGVPTVSYDGNDYKPIGILGRTTKNGLFRGDEEPEQDMSRLMEEILVEKKYTKQEPSFIDACPDFKSHLDFVNNSSEEKKYFDINEIKTESRQEKMLRWRILILGASRYFQLSIAKDNHKRNKEIKDRTLCSDFSK